MGYQESFVSFNGKELLLEELKKYIERDNSECQAHVVCVDRVKKAVTPFAEGELLLVVSGERHPQRHPDLLKAGLGIDQVKEIVFIDNPLYMERSAGDLNTFLGTHFESLRIEDVLKEEA